MVNHQIETLKQFGEFQEKISLQNLTTLKIGGDVAGLLYPTDTLALIGAVQFCSQEQIPFKVLGNGSNILASDEDYEGIIIKFTRTLNDVYFLNDQVLVGAGTSLVLLSNLAMKRSLTGLEWAAGIPATIGGAIYMNAGAYKQSMSDIVKEVLVLKGTSLEWIALEECDFSYRHSCFSVHRDWIIVSARLQLQEGLSDEIKEVMNRRKTQRISTQPLDAASCGSTFRNPVDRPSWQYIEECGLRGFAIGGAQVSLKHANFLINTGRATAQDMVKLIDTVKQSVKEKFNVDLQLEVEPFNWNKKDR